MLHFRKTQMSSRLQYGSDFTFWITSIRLIFNHMKEILNPLIQLKPSFSYCKNRSLNVKLSGLAHFLSHLNPINHGKSMGLQPLRKLGIILKQQRPQLVHIQCQV